MTTPNTVNNVHLFKDGYINYERTNRDIDKTKIIKNK